MTKQMIRIRKFFYCCLVGLALSACAQEATPPEAAVSSGEIQASDLYSRIENSTAPLIIDVRSAGEFSAGHLPGALNIAHSEFVDSPAASLALLPTADDAEIVVHCVSGKRAGIAMDVMAAAGYTNVSHLTGDFSGWEAAGYPLEMENE
jgi:phage shock protein E